MQPSTGCHCLTGCTKEYEQGHRPRRVLEELAEIYRRTDAFAIVSGEYNHGIPPALKNLLDHFLEEYFFRPSGDRLLLSRPVWWCAGSDAAAHDACRTRNAKYSLTFACASH